MKVAFAGPFAALLVEPVQGRLRQPCEIVEEAALNAINATN